MTAITSAIRRYRHRKAFRASLVKRPLDLRFLAVGMARFNGINMGALRRLVERVLG